MNLDEIYKMMRDILESIYENDSDHIKLSIPEFMQLLKMVCYMKQIRHIVDGV